MDSSYLCVPCSLPAAMQAARREIPTVPSSPTQGNSHTISNKQLTQEVPERNEGKGMSHTVTSSNIIFGTAVTCDKLHGSFESLLVPVPNLKKGAPFQSNRQSPFSSAKKTQTKQSFTLAGERQQNQGASFFSLTCFRSVAEQLVAGRFYTELLQLSYSVKKGLKMT
ncbi:hypothetical protein Anapl_17743 [Anas platyrhynchos]|uniref:Uncharacterized protein n=1 Tax=Anas platyrhynchos TaxID=8839 RepID=R0LJZ6_ANAPL|nr:hypothetical protein Anapl_17743 [Anas platyrhynchos]